MEAVCRKEIKKAAKRIVKDDLVSMMKVDIVGGIILIALIVSKVAF